MRIIIKMGAPIKAVRIPIGTSDGGVMVRLMVSAVSSNTLPKIALMGKIIW
jgi:hypothetical protein